MFGGLALLAAGATASSGWIASAGMLSYAAGLATFGVYVHDVLATLRRRKVPTAALHLVAAVAWLGVTTFALIVFSATEDYAAIHNFIVVGGAAGFVFQAVLGAWSFLLPSLRAAVPQIRRRELVAMELGGRAQLFAYNVGLLAVLLGRLGLADSTMAGVILTWCAASWAVAKSWGFPLLAGFPVVHERSERWWAAFEG
jgi:hypothetical protein